MILNLQTLSRILPDAKFFGLSGAESFDFFNITYLKQFDELSPREETLYFVVYEDHPEKMGWYNKPFDRSLNLRASEKTVFVVDDRMADSQLVGMRYIRVNNIYQAIDKIRQYIVSLVNPVVIGVTGSVGKTTGTALIQSVLEKKFGCGRAYSKRLTPLTLSSWLVNFLEPSHQFLALEYAMYRKYHIDILTDLLRPHFSVFLNIRRSHLGVGGINTLQDIQEGKSALVRKSNTALLNMDDPLVSALKRKGDLGFSLVDSRADAFVGSKGDRPNLFLNYTKEIIEFTPYVKTNLFCYQAVAAGLLGSYLGISSELITDALQGFRPAEHRINWIDIFGEKVLFEGDVTGSERMLALSEHQYPSSILLVHSFDFGEENVLLQVDDFNQAFAGFDEVRVLDTEENRNVVSQYSLRNLLFMEKDKFLSNIADFEFRVLHFAIYWRKYKDLGYLMEFVGA